jgi:hypothetical protein
MNPMGGNTRPVGQMGWICPRCGACYAPWVVQCFTCGTAKVSGEEKLAKKELLIEGLP